MKAELAGASTVIDATSRRHVAVEIDVGELGTSLLLVTVPVS